MNSNKEEISTANKSSGCENAFTQKSEGKIAVYQQWVTENIGNGTKSYYCPFCKKPFSKLPRHMESAHSTESEITALLAFKKEKVKRCENAYYASWEISAITEIIVKCKEKKARLVGCIQAFREGFCRYKESYTLSEMLWILCTKGVVEAQLPSERRKFKWQSFICR